MEHTVPRFKRDRHSGHVLIAGILSPYLKLEYIDNPDSAANLVIQDIQYLGETSWPIIENLCGSFTTSKVEIRHSADRTVPPWLLDYPDAWYRQFDARCKALRDTTEWPADDELCLLYDEVSRITVIPRLIAAGIDLSPFFRDLLDPWQRELCNKILLNNSTRVALPYLFLLLLSDFLDRLDDEPPSFSPQRYRELLYADGRGPLGLVDPLGIIDRLCSSLEVLWQHRGRLNLSRFRSFRFSGLGLLQGREDVHSQWKTILAYCGGWVYQRDDAGKWLRDLDGEPKKLGKCGHTPLVLGQEHLCHTCHKLICGECGFCSQTCEDQGLREARSTPATIIANDFCFEYSAPHEDWVETGSPPSYLDECPPIEIYQDWVPGTSKNIN